MFDIPGVSIFRLTPRDHHSGVACDQTGTYVADVALLAQRTDDVGRIVWMPRPVATLNLLMSESYGIPVDMTSKVDGLRAIANAFNTGNLTLATIATLHLRLPDPPTRKARFGQGDLVKLALGLRGCGILKAGWDPSKHPRWPAGDTESRGGQFAPAEQGDSEAPSSSQNVADHSSSDQQRSPVIPAQAAIPWFEPLDIPFEPLWPPIDIAPPAIPNQQERELPPLINPFPRKRKCVEEWDAAYEFCEKEEEKGNLKPGYGGYGKDFRRCVLGQVSEECGGNRLEA